MDTNSINLLRTQATLTQKELRILSKLKYVSIIVSIVLIVSGLLVGIAYFAGRIQFAQLDEDRGQLLQSLNLQAKKQILLLSTKDRLPLISRTLESQYPWEKVLADVFTLASPPFLQGLTVEENNLIRLTAQTGSIDDVQRMVDSALALESEKKIQFSKIESMQIGKDQIIEVVLSFTPLL